MLNRESMRYNTGPLTLTATGFHRSSMTPPRDRSRRLGTSGTAGKPRIKYKHHNDFITQLCLTTIYSENIIVTSTSLFLLLLYTTDNDNARSDVGSDTMTITKLRNFVRNYNCNL